MEVVPCLWGGQGRGRVGRVNKKFTVPGWVGSVPVGGGGLGGGRVKGSRWEMRGGGLVELGGLWVGMGRPAIWLGSLTPHSNHNWPRIDMIPSSNL